MKKGFTNQDVIRAIEILELPKDGNFTNDDVNRRWRELNSRFHPDKGGSNYIAKQLNEAREILRDWLKSGKPGFDNKQDEDEADRRQREAWERAQKAKQGQTGQQDSKYVETNIRFKKPLWIYYGSWFLLLMVVTFINVHVVNFSTNMVTAALSIFLITMGAAYLSVQSIYKQVKRKLTKDETKRFYQYSIIPFVIILTILYIPGVEPGASFTAQLQEIAMVSLSFAIYLFVGVFPVVESGHKFFAGHIENKGSDKSNPKSSKRRWYSRNFQVAMGFWSDGILRIGVIAAITAGVYATVQTDFWEYTPVTKVKAEYVVICWPKHYYGENITFAEGEGVSYVNPEALPPDIRAYYEGKNAEIMAMLDDPRSELMKKAKWGGYPVVTVWNEAQKKPGEPLLEVKAVDSETGQTCRKFSQEAQRVALHNN